MTSFSRIALLAIAGICAAVCQETKSQPFLPPRVTPIPEQSATGAFSPTRDEGDQDFEKQKETLIKGPPARRYAIPGAVRWKRELDKPITYIRWTPLAGLIVSAGRAAHNITSRGEHRWRYVAGRAHRLFEIDAAEVVWSPEFGMLGQLLKRGRQGWTRKWSGELVTDERGRVYLLDAGTVAAIGADGRDKWRASPDGVRKLESPFPCEGGILFHGVSGLQRVAVRVTERGTVMQQNELGRGAVLIGAGPACRPLVWRDGNIALLDDRGRMMWSRPWSKPPFVRRLSGGFAVLGKPDGKAARLELITDQGRVVRANELPISGRLTSARMLHQGYNRIDVIGLCLDVTSPCARPEGNRGPFNALLMAHGSGEFRTLIRHVRGHLGFAPYPDGGLVTASSNEGDWTDLTLRDSERSIVWQVTLPGRLSVEPYIGPSGEVYVATCHGWECAAPFRLYAITGRAPLPDSE